MAIEKCRKYGQISHILRHFQRISIWSPQSVAKENFGRAIPARPFFFVPMADYCIEINLTNKTTQLRRPLGLCVKGGLIITKDPR